MDCDDIPEQSVLDTVFPLLVQTRDLICRAPKPQVIEQVDHFAQVPHIAVESIKSKIFNTF